MQRARQTAYGGERQESVTAATVLYNYVSRVFKHVLTWRLCLLIDLQLRQRPDLEDGGEHRAGALRQREQVPGHRRRAWEEASERGENASRPLTSSLRGRCGRRKP
jgi:hypothetical protein